MKTLSIGGQLTDKRTVPAYATPAYVAGQNPEFLDAAGLQARFGIRRSLAYALLADGVIHGVSLRRKNRTRGKRLFCCDSVRDYLHQQMEAENETA